MASHYVSVPTAADASNLGTLYNLDTGTSSTAADVIELRVLDGASLSRKDVLLALEKFCQFIKNVDLSSAFSLNP